MSRAHLTSAIAAVARRLVPAHPCPSERTSDVVERLESRRLLATINWVNEFSDNFDSYGTNEAQARNIVRRAIADWEAVIVDFNYDDTGSNQSNTYNLTVQAEDIGGRGSAQVTSRDDGTDRKPDAATVRMDNNGTTWYFDNFIGVDGIPDDGEFTQVNSLFNAEAVGGTADTGNDFYRTIVHEIGHAMGIFNNSSGFFKIADNLVDSGFNDPFSSGSDLLEVRIGGVARYTMTENGGGHLFEGGGGYTGPTHPFDLMNPGRTSGFGERSLISDDNALLLRDVYGYDIILPSQINTFHANLNRSTNVLTVNGDIQGVLSDNVDLERSGTNAQIEYQNGGTTGARELIPEAEFTSIVVNTGDGTDDVDVDRLVAGKTVTINLGEGNDRVDVAPDDGDIDTFVLSDITVNGGGGTSDDILFEDENDGVGGDTWTVGNGVVSKSTRNINFTGIENLRIDGADVATTYNVNFTNARLDINSGTAIDTFNVGGGDFDNNIGAVVNINDFTGTNNLTIDDSVDTVDDDYFFENVGGNDPYRFTKSSEPLGLISWTAEVNQVDLLANTGSNEIEFGAPTAFLATQDFDIFGGDGNDILKIGSGSNGIANMDANVTFDGEGGIDTFDYLAQNVGAIATRVFNNSTLTGGTGGVFTASVGTEVFNLVVGNGNDVIDVNSLRSGLELAIVGNPGDDTVNIAAASDDFDTNINGLLTFAGNGGFDRALLNDTGDGGADPYDITSISPNTFTPASQHDFTKEIGGTFRFFNDIELFDIDGNAGNNTFSLLGGGGLPLTLDLNISGGEGDDVFTLGDGTVGIAFYDADMIFNGDAGTDTVVVLGQGLVGSDYTVTSTTIDNEFLTNEVTYFTTENIELRTGTGGDNVAVLSLSTSVAAFVDTGNGDDVVDVGAPGGTVETVDGTLDVNLFGGNDTLNYNDAANSFVDTYLLDGFNISRSASGTVTWDSNANTVNVFGGTATNTFNINVSTFVDYNVFAGGGNDIVNVNNALGFGIDLDTEAGSDDVFINTDDSSLARVTFTATDRLDELAIGDGGEVDIEGGGDKVLTVASLDINTAGVADGFLNIRDNAIVVDYAGASPLSSVRSLVQSGFNGGAFNGDGIRSSNAGGDFAVGYGESAVTGTTSLFGTSVDSTSVVVRYTVNGDANLDGTVNLADFGRL
ncbi:MAG: hypothetical protein AAGI46_07640, partial [Planctomycetota bacterium]